MKGAVDFQPVEREVADIAERRIAGAEIIQGQRDAQRPQAMELRDHVFRVAEQNAFGEFEIDQRGADAGGLDRGGDRLEHVAAAELNWRQIDGDMQVG